MSDISISISLSAVGPSAPGFGIPLIASPNATFPDRVRTYTDLPSFQADFTDPTSPEVRAAEVIFGQDPAPSIVKVGRCVGVPTQTYVIAASAVRNSSPYAVNVKGQFPDAAISITSGGSATNDAIIAALVTALNTTPSKNFTAAATGTTGSQVCTVTANSPGAWFSLEVVDVTALAVKQTHSDPVTSIATDLAAMLTVDPDFYGVITLYDSQAYVNAAAAWVQSNGKIYAPTVNETAAITTAISNGDTLDALHTSAYNRVLGQYHPSPAAFLGAGLFGRMLPIDPGKDDWKWPTISGMPSVALTPDQIAKLTARDANSYRTYLGDPIAFNGTMADGTFVDIIRGRDWLATTIQLQIYSAIKAASDRGQKIPFNDAGIAAIAAELKTALKAGFAAGVINDDFTITIPKKSSISPSNVAARNLAGISFSATLQGSVHDVPVTGSISA